MGSDRIAKTSMPISYYKRYAQRNYGKTTAEQHAFYFLQTPHVELFTQGHSQQRGRGTHCHVWP